MPFKDKLYPDEASVLASNIAVLKKFPGSVSPASWLAFNDSATRDAFWSLSATDYTSGNVTVTILWGADTATSGTVRWQAAIAAVTPETDATDPSAKSYGTAVTVDDAHLGTTARRLMRATLTLSGSSLDSLAQGDEVWLKISRVGGNVADNLSGDAWLNKVLVS
ncbi:hypothetical protein AB0I81_40255 [Nonomuraea sp. NPDC050404]|uniref:hypothetical protein n=1 Tax=Nonomuraea sp. NPDC050404 TaxID=3155783 RepID=UPI0033E2FFE7